MNKNSDLMSTYSPGSVPHYGDKASPYEAIKVIRAWDLNFSLGNVLKYVARAGKKPGASRLEDLRKARDYLDEEIASEAAKMSCESQAQTLGLRDDK